MTKPNSRILELTIISGESLTLAGNRRIKKNTYVIIKTESTNSQISNMDTENGPYPIWGQKFNVNMPMHATFFTLEVRCKNSYGDHAVGSVNVPVSDFTRWYFPVDYLHFLSYRLRDRYGERNGIINLSVKVKSEDEGVGAGGGGSMGCSSAGTGWKYGGGRMGQGVAQGVVVGVPYRY
ncbi:putative C2 domain-containing protein [Helianthus annuus]|uniref:C2 domain-containing protein n=1 Tax=Helianthus annuus TaxID=4232 RepID=A0A251SYH3_HELAN|nr:BON1-associated protein 2 [Helianthus annuus]KAF5776031.1 putative C2 domain-containing protein [Helianthus annuus]